MLQPHNGRTPGEKGEVSYPHTQLENSQKGGNSRSWNRKGNGHLEKEVCRKKGTREDCQWGGPIKWQSVEGGMGAVSLFGTQTRTTGDGRRG